MPPGKTRTFWCSEHRYSTIKQAQGIYGRSVSWTIGKLIDIGFQTIRQGKDMPAEYEKRIAKINEAWKEIVDQRDKDLLQLTEKLNKIELSMERSAIR